MKTLKAKLTALFMTIGCFAVCFGAGVAIATQPEATQVTASAAGAEVHELGKFDLHVNSSVGGAAGVNSLLYLKRADGGELPIKDWSKAFAVAREGSFKINGVPFTPAEIKSTGDGFWVNFGAVDAGAVVTLDGIFVYRDDATSVKYIIEESSFKWTGSGWVVLGETLDYASYNISTIAPAGGCTASVVYAYPTVEAKPENASWDYQFTFKAGSGSGICLNGEQLSGYEIKQPGDFYIVLGKAAAAGDVLTIDGFFYNDTIAKAITFNNSSLVYDGSAWATNDAGVANTFTITEIGATGDSTDAVVYPYPMDETQKPTTGSWAHKYTFVADSGEGITLNGAPLTGYEMKQPGDFYIVLGKTAVAGDVLILDGIFYSADANARMIFCDSTLRYNGTTWETYNYIDDTYVGKVVPTSDSTAKALYLLKENSKNFTDSGNWDDVLSFDPYSGVGVTLNGENVLTADIKTPASLYLVMGKEAQVGDLLVVEGAFYNNDLNVRYVVDKTELEWTGSAWVEHINYTTYNVGAVTAVEGATGVYFSFAETLPVSTWDQAFLLESGNGITVNGTGVDMVNNVKSVGRLYATLGDVKSGDILTIGGTFYNEFNAVKYVVDESTFVFNGTAWVDQIELDLGEVVGVDVDGDGAAVYLKFAEGVTLPISSWDYAFGLESGDGIKVDGVAVDMTNNNKSVGNKLYVQFAGVEVKEGSILTISGTFSNAAKRTKYTVDESKFVFNGTAWEVYIDYTTYTFNELSGANGCTDSVIYAYPTAGDALPSGDWDNAFTLESGAGLKLNDTVLEGWEIKQPGDLYIVLNTTASEGDVFTIDGTFINKATSKKFVFNNCKLEYNGTTWVTVKNYTTYDLGKVVAVVDGNVSGGYLKFADGVTLPISSWDYAFMLFSGKGITVDGEPIDMTNNVKSVGDKLYVTLTPTTASTNSTLSISGTFYNEALATKYVVEESKFTWNGSAWVDYIDYTTYDIGGLKVSNHSVSGVNAKPGLIYLDRADGQALPIQLWANPFTLESGDGLKLNGEAISFTEMQSSDAGIYLTFAEVKAGDILSISGTFACPTQAAKYVIAESKFTWNGSGWENYIEYTTHDLGQMTYKDGNATSIYLKRADGGEIEIATTENNLHWDTAFTFVADSGVGITLNGTQISMNDVKFPGSMYIGLGTTAVAGDVLVVGGTFYSSRLQYKYIIEESRFVFNGTTWSDLQSSYTVSNLQPTASSTAKAPVYLKINGDTNLPITSDAYTFDHTDGAGFVREGSQLKMTAIKSTADGFNFKFAKSSSIAAGEVFTLSGTFYCEELDVTLIIEECTITWTGFAWEVYKEPTVYTTYTINELGPANGCSSTVIYAYPTKGDALPSGDWDNRFTLESGEGLKLNGVTLSGWEIKQPGDLYIVLGGKTAVKGDVFTIDGTFINETTAKKFVFNNCMMKFDGTTWKTKADTSGYTTYNIGELILHVNSSTGAASGNSNQLYLQRADGEELPFMSWSVLFTADEDGYFKVNGNTINASEIKSTDGGLFFLFPAASAGTVITVGGTFVCDSQLIKYVIEESKFVWTGSGWALVGKDYSDLIAGVGYDTVTIVNLGFGVEETVTGLVDGAGLSYVPSAGNTTGSLKFRLGINAADMSAGAYHIRLRGTAWDGIHFVLGNGRLVTYYLESSKSIPLNNNTYHVIELGVIDTADGNSMWIYAKVDGVLYISDLMAKTAVNVDGDADGKTFGAYSSTHLSLYGDLGAVTLYDPDRTAITYTTEFGTHTEYVERNAEYTLPQGKTYNTFIGWKAADGTIYKAGDTIWLDGSMSFTAISIEFFLEDGAAIRLSDSTNESGIRFTTYISEADLTTLESNGITVNYGTLIIPLDYLGAGQAPNLEQFNAGENILKIPSTYSETEDGYVVYRGAMQKLDEGNYGRLFAGRGYMEITVNGETRIVYTPFDYNENVRSIRYIAQKFQKDTDEYNKISNTKKEVVDVYASINEIKLLNYKEYADNNFLNLIAWYYPELDPSNAYENATNIAIAQKIKAAGMTAVYLDGEHHLDLSDTVNVEKTRQIINFFWNHGLKTIAFGSNASTNLYLDYSTNSFPDFSDCEGFMGYLVWDEPQEGSFGTLAAFANNFETVYAGTGVNFMVNLLPSYATMFNSGSSNWWESSLTTLDEESYKAYVKNYCETVLSQIDGGEKWLSMDSYPINADKSLTGNFLFDLAVLKYYAMEYDAHAHAALQSSGWEEDGNTSKNRMPTEAEMRMQAYTAMAFGVDSISWWSYSDKRNDNQQNPTDNDDYYTRFANVNKELSAISAIYSAFEWQGVILGAGKDNGNWSTPDEDYAAYNVVKGQIGKYELSVSDTKLLSGVSTNKTNWNYLMGVMQDLNGNEAYVLSNYNSHEEDRAQTLTLTFDANVTEVIIYRGGVAQTVSVSNKTLAISLATGEGVIVIPSKIG